jgi:hypothetical protein
MTWSRYLGDNFEVTTLFFAVAFQLTAAAVIHSLGGRFRLPLWRNYWLCLSATALYGTFVAMLLTPPSTFSAILHVASIGFNSASTVNPVWQAYQDGGGQPSSGMSLHFRVRLVAIYVAGNVAALLWEAVVVQGVVRNALIRRFPPPSANDNLNM